MNLWNGLRTNARCPRGKTNVGPLVKFIATFQWEPRCRQPDVSLMAPYERCKGVLRAAVRKRVVYTHTKQVCNSR